MRPVALAAVLTLAVPMVGLTVGRGARSATGQASTDHPAGTTNAAAIVSRCAEAMGGERRVRAVRSLRAEVVYTDHGDAPVVHEVLRPNRYRAESAGRYVAIFDGARASYRSLNPGQSAGGLMFVPAEDLADFEADIAWLFPAFFDHPAEYIGTSERAGTLCHGLRVKLPRGATMTYLIDASTGLVKVIAADLTIRGNAVHLEREWREHRVVQGIRYPGSMTYQGRDKTVQIALVRSVVFNPPLDESRLRVPAQEK